MKIEKSFQIWYPEWLQTAKAIVIEHLFTSRFEMIRGRWELGKHIVENFENFERAKIYGEKLTQKIAKDLKTNERMIERCILFYKKYPEEDFDKLSESLPEGKNLSWTKLITKYLPLSKECKHKWDISQHWFCIICGIKRFSDPYKKKYENL